MLLLSLVLMAVSYLLWLRSRRHPAGFPPGPRMPLPVIGDALSIGTLFTEGFRHLADTYGDAVGFYLGRRRVVLLSDPDQIAKVFSLEELADRPPFDDTEKVRGGAAKDSGAPGVLLINGPSWVEQRRFALKTLRDLGFGKKGVEALVEEEVEALCQRIEESKEAPLQMQGFFDESALKALWKVLTNEDFDVGNSELPAVWKRMPQVFANSNYTAVQLASQNRMLVPILELLKIETFGIVMPAFDRVTRSVVRRHKDNFQEDSILDFIDAYLKQMFSAKPDSSFHGSEGDRNLHAVVNDLVQAGTDTTSNTLSWSMLFLVKHPEVQDKLKKELDRVIGRSRLATWEDRSSLPYLEATLHEVQRCANLVPWGLQHQAIRDITLGDFIIPCGAVVYPFMERVMFNSKLFPDPELFKPERFINNGRFEPSPHVIPFGVGKRRCLGETLARMELFRFLAGVAQRFDIQACDKGGLDKLRGTLGGLNGAPRFEVRFKPRQ